MAKQDKTVAKRRIYRFPDLRPAGVFFSNKHLMTLEDGDKFPKRVHLGANTVGWIADEIDRWVDERIRLSRLQDATKNQQRERGNQGGRGRRPGSRVETDAGGKRRVIPPTAPEDDRAAAA